MNIWVVFAKSCDECGGDTVCEIFYNKPTEAEKQEVADSIGGMFCIKVWEIEKEINIHVEAE